MKKKIFEQFKKPQGLLGSIIGWIMAIENRDRIDWAISQLKLKKNDNILEIGFGPGVSIMKIASKLDTGFVYGVDISPVMVAQAKRRNSKLIKEGKVNLFNSTSFNYEPYKNYFNNVLAINVFHFEENPMQALLNIHSVLRENGCFQIVFEPHWIKSEDKFNEIATKLNLLLQESVFSNVETNLYNVKGKRIIHAKCFK